MSITPGARKRSTLAVGRRIARPKRTPFSSAVIPYHCDAAPRALSSPIRCVVPDFGLPPAMANKRAQYFHRVGHPSLQSCRYVSFFCRLSLDSHIVAHQIPASRFSLLASRFSLLACGAAGGVRTFVDVRAILELTVCRSTSPPPQERSPGTQTCNAPNQQIPYRV